MDVIFITTVKSQQSTGLYKTQINYITTTLGSAFNFDSSDSLRNVCRRLYRRTKNRFLGYGPPVQQAAFFRAQREGNVRACSFPLIAQVRAKVQGTGCTLNIQMTPATAMCYLVRDFPDRPYLTKWPLPLLWSIFSQALGSSVTNSIYKMNRHER